MDRSSAQTFWDVTGDPPLQGSQELFSFLLHTFSANKYHGTSQMGSQRSGMTNSFWPWTIYWLEVANGQITRLWDDISVAAVFLGGFVIRIRLIYRSGFPFSIESSDSLLSSTCLYHAFTHPEYFQSWCRGLGETGDFAFLCLAALPGHVLLLFRSRTCPTKF